MLLNFKNSFRGQLKHRGYTLVDFLSVSFKYLLNDTESADQAANYHSPPLRADVEVVEVKYVACQATTCGRREEEPFLHYHTWYKRFIAC